MSAPEDLTAEALVEALDDVGVEGLAGVRQRLLDGCASPHDRDAAEAALLASTTFRD